MISEKEFQDLKIGDFVYIYYIEDEGGKYLYHNKDDASYDKTLPGVVLSISDLYIWCGYSSLHGINGRSLESYLSPKQIRNLINKKIISENYNENLIMDGLLRGHIKSKAGSNVTAVTNNIAQGMNCIHPACRDFVLWAESNLPNNQFMCFRCRDSEPWKYNELKNKIEINPINEE